METTVHTSAGLMLCVTLALVAPAASAASDALALDGSGGVETNCMLGLTPGCTITVQGQVDGSIGASSVTGATLALRIDLGGPPSLNGNPESPAQGACVSAAFVGAVTTAAGDTLEFRHSGLLCEEAGPGSPYHYNAVFRISGGTGAFGAARGLGTLTATITPAGALLRMRGSSTGA